MDVSITLVQKRNVTLKKISFRLSAVFTYIFLRNIILFLKYIREREEGKYIR